MQTSESIKELATALAKAQAKMAGAKKDATNPHFKSKYADLASVWDACRSALTDHGLSVVQMARHSDKDEVVIDTRLCHSSGEWMEGTMALPVSKADAQGYGSALTYARRYALAAAVGIAPEDDDGNVATAAKPISGHQVNQDEFDGLTPDEKDLIMNYSTQIQKRYAGKEDVMGYIKSLNLSHEWKMALWALLPSHIRTAIKKSESEMRAAA